MLRSKSVRVEVPTHVWFEGDYSSWSEASAVAGGYDDRLILEKVLSATLKVKRGEAAYERDSVVFQEPDCCWPLLANLMWVAAQQGGRLRVLDFGGSLGSAYFQHRKYFEGLQGVSWAVVEQPHYVNAGRLSIEDQSLKFFDNVETATHVMAADVLLLGSVLQYLSSPWEQLNKLLGHSFDFILIDRTAFLENQNRDRLTVQTVPPSIYEASYPAWFLSRRGLFKVVENHYECVSEWINQESYPLDGNQTAFRGFCFKRRTLVR